MRGYLLLFGEFAVVKMDVPESMPSVGIGCTVITALLAWLQNVIEW